MSRTVSKAILLFALVGAPGAAAQDAPAAPQGVKVISSEIALSREQAELKLELANGRKLTLSTVAGNSRGILHSGVSGSGDDLSQILSLGVRRGDELDRSWRALLNEAMDTPSDDLAALLTRWEAPSGGQQLDAVLESVLAGAPMEPLAPLDPNAPQFNDSLTKLQDRINKLEQELEEKADDLGAESWRSFRTERGWFSPFRHIGRGVADIVSLLVTFAVLFGLGFALIFFGGRKYLDEVAEAARRSTTRSFLVGLAASFLVIPAFVLGIVVLAISIVGIPALLLWIPAFPLAVILGTLLGYLAVAHATGEAMAERRFYGGDWFSRANSYYYLLTGLGLLLALFLAANVVEMAGPWLGFIEGILIFLGVVLTWAAATTGFGAVLITRAGTRPLNGSPVADSEVYAGSSEI